MKDNIRTNMKNNLIVTYKCYLSDISKLQLSKQLLKPNKLIGAWGHNYVFYLCTWSCHNPLFFAFSRDQIITNGDNI